MRIGQAAVASGLSVKAIRHYETLGLLGTLPRRGAYRDFSSSDVRTLEIIARCRKLGLSLPEVKRVLGLVSSAAPRCPPPDAMLAILDAKLDAIRSQIHALRDTEKSVVETRRYVELRKAATNP